MSASLSASAVPFQIPLQLLSYFLLTHLFRAQGRNAKVILFQTYRQGYTSLVFLCCSVFVLITLAHKSLESYRGFQVLAVLRHFPE